MSDQHPTETTRVDAPDRREALDERTRHLKTLAVAGALATVGAFAGLAASVQDSSAGGSPDDAAPAGAGLATPGGAVVPSTAQPDGTDGFADPSGGFFDRSGGAVDPFSADPSGSMGGGVAPGGTGGSQVPGGAGGPSMSGGS